MTPLLLDTCSLIDWSIDRRRLSEEARLAVADGRSTVFVSAATAWEIAIKRRIGKLDAPSDIAGLLEDNRFIELPVTVAHGEYTSLLPLHHKDPFDRLLVAQAKSAELTLITRDREIFKYDVPVIAA